MTSNQPRILSNEEAAAKGFPYNMFSELTEEDMEKLDAMTSNQEAFRIWALHCPFKKDGFPSLGTFGKTIEGVVVMKVETWTALCAKHPGLAAEQFEVGSHDQ